MTGKAAGHIALRPFFFDLSYFSDSPCDGLQVSLNKPHEPLHHGTRYNGRKNLLHASRARRSGHEAQIILDVEMGLLTDVTR
jgi:hypothetical protein